MSYTDRIDLSIPSEEITSILSLFASAQEKLELLPQVGPQERKHLAKLGLKNEALALQIIEVGRLNPDLIPRGIDFELIDRDRIAREQLRVLKLVLERLLGRVTDAMLLTGVDLYAAALSIYHCLRRNAKSADLRASVAELKRGFARPSRKKKEEQGEVAATTVPVNKEAAVPAPASMPDANQTVHLQTTSVWAQRRDAAATMEVRSSNAPETYNSARLQQIERRAVATRAVSTMQGSQKHMAPKQYVVVPSEALKPQSTNEAVSFFSPPMNLPIIFSDGFTPFTPVFVH